MDEDRSAADAPAPLPAAPAIVVEEAKDVGPAEIASLETSVVDPDARRAKYVALAALATLPLVPLARVTESAGLASVSTAPLFAGAAAAYLGFQARPDAPTRAVAPANPGDARHAMLGGALAAGLWLVMAAVSMGVQERAQARALDEALAAEQRAQTERARTAAAQPPPTVSAPAVIADDPTCPADGATRFYASPGAKTRCTGEPKPPVSMSWREAQGFFKAHGLHVRRGMEPTKLWGEGDALRIMLTFDVTESPEPAMGMDLLCQGACPEGGWQALATSYAGVEPAALAAVVPGAPKATLVKTARGTLPIRVDAQGREVFFGVNATR